MAASRTPAGPKCPTTSTFKGNSHGSAAGAPRTRPPPLPRRPGKRPQQQQQQQQQQRYFGRTASNVTDHLKKVVPSHSFHPSLLPLPAPSFHRKASSISAYIESQVRPPPQPRRPYTAPDVYFGRRASNVTDHLRYIPPSHLGLDAQSKSLPYFGRLATSVTDPSKYMEAGISDGDCADNITCHWSAGSRPGSARLPVAPQHVSKEVLFSALSARGDRPCSGRRPTNIGSLLKHQFAHVLGDPGVHADHEQKMSFPNYTSPNPVAPDQVLPEPQKSKNSSAGGAICSPRPANKHVDEHSHEAAPKSGQMSIHMTAQRPRTAPAAENTTKRTREGDMNNTQQHLPSPRMVASPRPMSARSAVGEKSGLKQSSNGKKQQMGENAAGASSEQVVKRRGQEDNTRIRDEEVMNNGVAWDDDAGMNIEDEERMTENGVGVTSGGVGPRSTQCDDNSSEVSEQLGSEKLELVRQWVQQEERPHAPKSHHLHKLVDHSRRATSITKYNIW